MQQKVYSLTEFTPRVYQQVIASKALTSNTLVVLPTGLGKTAISLLVALHVLQNTDKKVIMVAPTKPLVEQHLKAFTDKSTVPEDECIVFTGSVAPEKRKQLFADHRLIFSTPQVIENDVVSGRISLQDVGLLVVDEAHRATGNYSYVWLVRQLYAHNPHSRVLSMTASPGTDLETVEEVVNNLRVEHIEYRNVDDPDVKPYVEETKVEQRYVHLTDDLIAVRDCLNKCFSDIVLKMKKHGALAQTPVQRVNKRDLLMLQSSLRGEMSKGEFDPNVIACISLGAMAIKVMHAQELVESQGVQALQSYLHDVDTQAKKKASKAVQQLVGHAQWRLASVKAKELEEVHPKMQTLHDILLGVFAKKKDAKVIVFSQYRDTLQSIREYISDVPGVSAELFVGQAKKKGIGMSQKEQRAMIEAFSNGEFNVACMSSVGEEGLDIPTVDAVIFYEPIPSAIRSIQRRGRTGRHETGKVIMLIAKGTRDEAYRWVAHHKEKNMYTVLDKVKKTLDKEPSPQKTLTATFAAPEVPKKQEGPCIYVDSREMHNTAVKLLVERGASLKMEKLDVGDILLSSRVGIEYKKTADFVDSILDGRLLEQLKSLKESFERPLVLVEGDNLYSVRNVHPHAIMGMLSTISISYGIPLLFTKDAEETATLLQVLFKREHEGGSSAFSPHASKKPKTERELLEYMVSSLPHVGMEMGKRLLRKFGTVKQLVDASIDDLREVDGVGEKTASDLYMFFRTVYK